MSRRPALHQNRRQKRWLGAFVVIAALASSAALTSLAAASKSLDAAIRESDKLWRESVEPLLEKNCFKCHGGVRQRGGLDLRSLSLQLRGGDNGPAIHPGDPQRSRLLQLVQPGADPHMPPDTKKQLSPSEIASLTHWIERLPSVESLVPAQSAPTNLPHAYVEALDARRPPAWTPPSGMPVATVIDRFWELGWRERKASPSPLSTDNTFIRRLYLDVAGRIPTEAERTSFLNDPQPQKRERAIDQLLRSPEHAARLREVFDVVLMGRADEGRENQRRDRRWHAYLENAFASNRPWDQIVAELIRARSGEPGTEGAVQFVHERNGNHQALAEAVAPIAYGVQMGCAQCHNHPIASELEQRHYWGLVAAFNRSKNVDTDIGPGVAESAIGGFVNFANLKKESQPALLAFPYGPAVEERRPAENEKEQDSPDLYRIPPAAEKQRPKAPALPKFSRREALASSVTRGNPALAKAAVNRFWALYMGRGLVHPVDMIDSRHPPSHPDLLQWLARDFESHGFDIRRLERALLLSRAYQLDSIPAGRTPAAPEAFARALEKPLSAEQIFRSLLVVASGQPPSADAQTLLNPVRRALVERFPEVFPVDYNAALPQAMFLSNSPLVEQIFSERAGFAVAQIAAAPRAEDRVRRVFERALGRAPTAEELRTGLDFLNGRPAESGVKQLLWALVAGPEYLLNH